ncbi:MAG: hypothetical protein AB2L14_09325 [Candidatus Xenobiia bacterium LiM19]
MTEETAGDKTNRLLLTIDGVLNDRTDAAELLNAVELTGNELQKARKDFFEKAARYNPSIRAGCQNEINSVTDIFNEYVKNLEYLSSYINSFDKVMLAEAGEKVAEIIDRLNMGFMQFRLQVMTLLGPSSHGGINTLLALCRGALHGVSCIEELFNSMEMQRAIAGNMIEQLRLSPGTELTESLIQFNRKLEKTLDICLASPRTLNPLLLAQMSRELGELGEHYKYIDISYLSREFSYMPTIIPSANLIINCSKLLAEGRVDRVIVLSIIRDFREMLMSVQAGTDEIRLVKVPDETVKMDGERMLAALHDLCDALDSYESAISGDDLPSLLPCEKAMSDAACSFEIAYLVIKDIADSEGLITCIKCGARNTPDNTKCHNCNTLLPAISAEKLSVLDICERSDPFSAQSGDTRMTTTVFRLFDSAEALLEQVISREEFLSIVQKMDALVRKAAGAVKSAPPPAMEVLKNDAASLEEARTLYLEAVDDLAHGLELFREFSDRLSRDTMDMAREVAWNGLSKLQKVQKLLAPLVQPHLNPESV